jgi:hypothetical protein
MPPTTSIISLRKTLSSPRNRSMSRSHFSQLIAPHPRIAQTARASPMAGPGAVGQHRRSGIGGPVQRPANKLHGVFSRRASRALRPSFASNATLTLRSKQSPPVAGTPARLVMQGQERSAVERDHVIGHVLRIFFKCAAVTDRLGVATRRRGTLPMRFIVRRFAGVAQCLIATAVIGDDVPLVKDCFGNPPLGESAACQLARPGRVTRATARSPREAFCVEFAPPLRPATLGCVCARPRSSANTAR